MFFLKFLIGLAFIAVGVFFNMKTEWMLSNFGSIQFFEEHLGTDGGSRLGYKLIGILVIFLGILLVTGLFDGFMYWLVSPLTRFSPGVQQ
jgi:hypothetical protein